MIQIQRSVVSIATAGLIGAAVLCAALIPQLVLAAPNIGSSLDGKCTKVIVDTFHDDTPLNITKVNVEVNDVNYLYPLPGAPVNAVTEGQMDAAVEAALIASGQVGNFALYYPGSLVHTTDSEGERIEFEFKYDRSAFENFEITLKGDTDNHIETFDCDPLGISIDKDDDDNTDDTQNTTYNGDATFTITVTNIGDVTLEDVVVSDALAANCNKNVGTLEAGEEFVYTCTDTDITANYTNSATVIGESTVSNDTVTDTDTTVVVVVASCGDSNVDAGEQCDDGNTTSGDGCSASCVDEPTCGDGTIETGEQCDDGNTTNGDGCSASCKTEAMPASCGDGTVTIATGEQCDDGNTTSGDGCSASCQVENAAVNPVGDGTSSVCTSTSDIRGYIYHDKNYNGEKDKDESGIEDVKVELLDEDGNEIEEDDTNSDGKFRFENYAPGDYILDVKLGDKDLDGYELVTEPGKNLNGKDGFTLKCDDDHTGTGFGFDTKSAPQGSPQTLAKTGGSSLISFILGLFR